MKKLLKLLSILLFTLFGMPALNAGAGDFLGGAAVGAAGGIIITSAMQKRHDRKRRKREARERKRREREERRRSRNRDYERRGRSQQ